MPKGEVVADAVDTDGHDLAVTFWATAGTEYTVNLHDLDFRGDRSFVYRLALTAGPRVTATIPAAGKRGETRDVEFVGYGLATGKPKLESVTRKVTFPADAKNGAFAYRARNAVRHRARVRHPAERLRRNGREAGRRSRCRSRSPAFWIRRRTRASQSKGRRATCGTWPRRRGGSARRSTCRSPSLDAGGKELARNDDLPGTTDAGLAFTLPADGTFTVVVSDLSGKSGTRAAVYRLTAEKVVPDFALTTVARLNVPLGGTADSIVKVDAQGRHEGADRAHRVGASRRRDRAAEPRHPRRRSRN